MFVQMISSKWPSILLPNLVLWCIIMSLRCCAKRLVCYFQGQGHSKGSYDQNMTVSTTSSELLILLLPNLIWWYIIISQSVLWRNWTVFEVKATQQNFKMSMNVCPNILLTTKLGMVMHHHELECLSKRWVCCLQGQGRNEGSFNQDFLI